LPHSRLKWLQAATPRMPRSCWPRKSPARFHSAAAADAAEQDFINRSKGGVPDEIPEVTFALKAARPWALALLKGAGLAPSTTEANRLIEGGGVRVDGSVVSDKGLKLAAGTYVVQVGKRKFARHPHLMNVGPPQSRQG
jgi:tyrosyl-tRNA synthetase